MRKYYTDKEFIKIVQGSQSISEVIITMSLVPAGGNYSTFHARVKRLNLKIDHFVGNAWSKGRTLGPRRPIEDYLNNVCGISSYDLKKRLLSESIFEYKCSKCRRIEWNNQPIPIELDHINGNHKDNTLSNLRLLCPNCHAQTDTYRGKNIKKALSYRKPVKVKYCQDCDVVISKYGTRCKSCAGKIIQKTKIEWPSHEDLLEMVQSANYLATSRHLGVSDNAIRKRLKNHS